MLQNELNSLERAVLEKLLCGDLPLLTQLRQQLSKCHVAKREYSGVGFFTDFIIPEDISRTPGLDIQFGDVIGSHPELKNGAGFVLFIKNGVLDMLEGYTYDEPWPSSCSGFDLAFVTGKERDWLALKEKLSRALRSSSYS